MPETQKIKNLPEFLREPIIAAQERLENFEEEAQKVLKELIQKGKASRKEIKVVVQRLSRQARQDWYIPEVKDRIGKLRDQGMERASELRDRAETFRSDALQRLEDLQSKAVAFLGVATRSEVEGLSKELERLSKKIEKSPKSGSQGKKTKKKRNTPEA